MEDKTVEIRWHGRGGQGAVTSAELLALTAIQEGKYAQAMPSFGPERRGAPVMAFNRVNNSYPIRTRAPVDEPDVVVVLDPGLLEIVDVTSGLKKDGIIVVNSSKKSDDIKKQFRSEWKIAIVDASKIAKETLGVPIVNTTMLGALIKAIKLIDFNSLEESLKERFGPKAKNNLDSCKKAYGETVIVKATPDQTVTGKIYQSEKLLTWREILAGAVVIEPGNARTYCTGDWKSANPILDYEKCNKCGLCYLYCPEGCIDPMNDGYFKPNLFYCKGCGICAKECPKNVINMIEV